jgi:penicillin-binding protein 2
VNITSVPDPIDAAMAFLDYWKAEDYASMYGMLTNLSQEAITAEDFEARYRDVAANGALEGIDYEILSELTNPTIAQVNYRVTLHSVLVGDIARDSGMDLSLEANGWRVKWEENLILPELAGGNYLSMDVRVPARGNIYDRDGHALVAQADAVALGLDTSRVDPESQGSLLEAIWRVTGIRPDSLLPALENYRNYGWYLPIGEVASDVVEPLSGLLTSFSGMVMQSFRSRYYFDGGIASQLVGYVSAIQPEEVEEFKRKGYRIDEKVGRGGLEYWGEDYLSGERGGALYVVSPEGKIVTLLSESEPQPAYSIYTTLEKDLQIQAQDALAGFVGAIVVLERDTGRVLAMVSSPDFDPNLFEPNNYNSGFLLGEIFNDPNIPLLNRATQGQYPLGSVYKVITMATALEMGLYDLEKTYECGHSFTEIQGFISYDWTYEKELPSSGTLTLPEGLMRSCNPFFQHIAFELYRQEMGTEITLMSEAFGLGEGTGIAGVAEEDGQIPVPESEVDAVNQAIGQGSMLVTPLQTVDFIAALGNGGSLYRPQIIERVESPTGETILEFEPELRGALPLSDETLEIVRTAMISVVGNPRGTAYHRFLNFPIPIAGKTGTAETGGGRDPHAWFAGYTFAEQEDRPDIAVVVIAENAGEGSDYAAPIFKRIVEIYFFGKPRTPYWWESQIGVTRTPTPEVTETPVPEETKTP